MTNLNKNKTLDLKEITAKFGENVIFFLEESEKLNEKGNKNV